MTSTHLLKLSLVTEIHEEPSPLTLVALQTRPQRPPRRNSPLGALSPVCCGPIPSLFLALLTRTQHLRYTRYHRSQRCRTRILGKCFS